MSGLARAVVLVTVIRGGTPVDLVVQWQQVPGVDTAWLVLPLGKIERWSGELAPHEAEHVKLELAAALRLADDDARKAWARWAS